MVAADGQTIAVAGNDPDVQFRADQPQAGRDGRSPAVNAVNSVLQFLINLNININSSVGTVHQINTTREF